MWSFCSDRDQDQVEWLHCDPQFLKFLEINMCFLVRRTNERNVIVPQHVMLALARLRYFLVERGIEEFSTPVYDEYFQYRTGVN